MSNETLTTSLGQCWAFPPRFSAKKGVHMAAGTDAVLQSLQVLFMTQTGERIMRENWGGGINDFLFENISDELLARLRSQIEEAILLYEPRVMVQELVIQPAANDVSQLRIAITVCLSGSDISEVIDGTLDLNEGQTLRLL